MGLEPPSQRPPNASAAALRAYLLGTLDFEAVLRLQRFLVYEVSGDRDSASLLLCEHAPLITVGRHGSRAHILYEPDELRARRWQVRWVNRGGGSLLHAPGQLAIYPIVALDRLGLGVATYLNLLHDVVSAVLADFGVRAERRAGRAGLWVGPRPTAAVGVAVRDWVTYFGAVLNVNPDLALFRRVQCFGPAEAAMTSLERERRGPLRPSLVRERVLEHFAARFGFGRTSLFFNHHLLDREPSAGGAVASSR
jgi:lipoyl(octanoyl) transferase